MAISWALLLLAACGAADVAVNLNQRSAPRRLQPHAARPLRLNRGGFKTPKPVDSLLRTIFTGLYAGPKPAQSPTLKSVKFLASGAVAGIISRTLVSPLEVIATVNMAATGAVDGVGACLARLWAAEGLAGFYKGNGANCLKVAPTKGIQFVAFEFFKRLILTYKRYQLRQVGDLSEPQLEPLDRLFAGGFAGMVAAACAYPLETVKSLLTVERGKYGGHGISHAMGMLVQEQGVSALYRGLVPTLMAMFPYVGVEFCIYETLKTLHETTFKGRRISTMETLAIGALSGLSAQSSCHPLDVVRKRLQLQGINGRPMLYRNMFDGLYGIAKTEGLKGLYKGLTPACFATIPATGSSYIVYEAAKNAFGIGSS
mmetsp:Transcript_6405/g.20514  ORF Transcript_6405/g.20514 Transcript_6405/m.20514 type:complete len:371 (+) Transcript_6405:90-1202(+)